MTHPATRAAQAGPGGPIVPEIAIVVVNYRTPELTLRALAAARAAAGGRSTELVVVDNGAADVAALRAGGPDVRVVALPENLGFAAGVNAGFAASRAETVLLLNSDAFPQDDAVDGLARYLEAHPRVGVVAPALVHEDGSRQPNAYRRFPTLLTLFAEFSAPLHPLARTSLHPHLLPPARAERPGRVAHVMGAAMLVRRAAYAAAGPLDEGYFLYLEETEWQRRLAAAGWEIHLEPAARVVHLERASSGFEVISPHFVRSAQRYFRSARSARAVMVAGAASSVIAARVASRLRPQDPRFPKLERGFQEVLREVRASRARS